MPKPGYKVFTRAASDCVHGVNGDGIDNFGSENSIDLNVGAPAERSRLENSNWYNKVTSCDKALLQSGLSKNCDKVQFAYSVYSVNLWEIQETIKRPLTNPYMLNFNKQFNDLVLF